MRIKFNLCLSSCWLYYGFLSTVHGNDLSGPTGQVASPLYPRSYMKNGVFYWRIMVDFGQAIVISFQEFFIDDYYSNCYSYVAVSNKVYSAIFVCASQIKRVVASDWLSWWEFKLNNYKILVMKFLKCALLAMWNVTKLTELLVWEKSHCMSLHGVHEFNIRQPRHVLFIFFIYFGVVDAWSVQIVVNAHLFAGRKCFWCYQPFKHQAKSHLPFAGIISSSPYSPH